MLFMNDKSAPGSCIFHSWLKFMKKQLLLSSAEEPPYKTRDWTNLARSWEKDKKSARSEKENKKVTKSVGVCEDITDDKINKGNK